MIGDVVGPPGCRALFQCLQSIIKETRADLVIANGENAADGLGLTPEIAEGLFKVGVDVITSGNHIWQRPEILSLLDSDDRILRPENYPTGVAGKGHCLLNRREIPIGVINLQGRLQLYPIRCPFSVASELIRKLGMKTRVSIVDFHAEAPEEKEALAFHLDGKVSAVLGTHTHVQTEDDQILEGGTAYITDVGMTGPAEGVIGMKREISLKRSLTQIPFKMEVQDSDSVIMGALVEIDPENGRAMAIQRLRRTAL
mgnify:CR=1 FL=1